MLLWRHQTGPRQLGLDSEFEKGIVLDAPAVHRVEVYVRQLRVFARVLAIPMSIPQNRVFQLFVRILLAASVLLTLVTFNPAISRSQQTQSGASAIFTLRIFDSQTGYAVEGAQVSWAQISETIPVELPNIANADPDGTARLELQPGGYVIEISAPGYRKLRTDTGPLAAGTTSPSNVALDPVTPPLELRKDVVEPQLRDGFELVHGYVVDSATRQPLAGVKVHLKQNGATAVTNARGYFSLYGEAPDVSQAKSPEEMPPTDTLFASAPGYKTQVETGQIYASESASIFRIALTRGEGSVYEDSTPGALAPPGTIREAPRKGPRIKKELKEWLSNPGQAMTLDGTTGSPINTTALADFVVPSSIIVGSNCSQRLGYGCTSATSYSLDGGTKPDPANWASTRNLRKESYLTRPPCTASKYMSDSCASSRVWWCSTNV